MIMNPTAQTPMHITIKGKNVEISQSIKVLGIKFDAKLSWDQHVANLTKKSNSMHSGLKTIRPKLTENQFLKIITSQYYGVNGCVVHSIVERKTQKKIVSSPL